MFHLFRRRKFPLGRLAMTLESEAEVVVEDVVRALKRHQSGDWGFVTPEYMDNEKALVTGDSLFSLYFDRNGRAFYIGTTADRSVTKIMVSNVGLK